MDKPILIILLSNVKSYVTPIEIKYKNDMLEIENRFKENETWYKNSLWLQDNLNLIITTDDSQFKYDNLKYYRNIILRKDQEFLSMNKLVSEYSDKECLLNAIKNYQYLRFERDCDYWHGKSEDLNKLRSSIFPCLKTDLQMLYNLKKMCTYNQPLHLDDIYLCNSCSCNIVVSQYDYDDDEPKFRIPINIKVNPDSEYFGCFSLKTMLIGIIRDIDLIMNNTRSM